MATAVSRVQSNTRTRERWFYLSFAAVAAAIVFAGFERTFYLKHVFATPRLPLLLHIHGFVFTLWLLLFFVQPLLVAFKRVDLHRKLGVVGGILAVAMLAVIVLTTIEVTKPGFRAGAPAPLRALSLPLINILEFGVLVAAGFWFRKKPETHKRLMVLATISILPAAVARLPIAFIQSHGALGFFGVTDAILLACIAYDVFSRRRLHPAYLWGGIFLIATQPACIRVGNMAWFVSFARWLTNVKI